MRYQDLLFFQFLNNLDPGMAEEMYYQNIQRLEQLDLLIDAARQDVDDLRQKINNETDTDKLEVLKKQLTDAQNFLTDCIIEKEGLEKAQPHLKKKVDYLEEIRKQEPVIHVPQTE